MGEHKKPNWVKESIEFFDKKLTKDDVVWEWGSGRSTQWLADRVKFVYSVEHQIKWHDIVSEYLKDYDNTELILIKYLDKANPGNNNIKYKHHKEYVNCIETIGKNFDAIVVDGRHRVPCVKKTMERLKIGGYLLFDDANRVRYKKTLNLLKEKWEHWDFIQKIEPPKCDKKTIIFKRS